MGSSPMTAEDVAAMTPNERADLVKSRPRLTLDDLPERTRQKFLDKGAEIEARRGR